jgi:P27 family predicted phage terminase small subunit
MRIHLPAASIGEQMPQPRKSQALHELHNTRSHDRAADISHVPAGRPRIPKEIRQVGLTRDFKELCSLLQERRTLTTGDVELITAYCFIKDRKRRNLKLLLEEGELCTYVRLDSNGVAHPQVKVNLRLKVCTDAERQMASILNQLGLTPVSKDRVRPTGKAKDEPLDEMEEFLNRKISPAPFVIRPLEQIAEENDSETQTDGN